MPDKKRVFETGMLQRLAVTAYPEESDDAEAQDQHEGEI